MLQLAADNMQNIHVAKVTASCRSRTSWLIWRRARQLRAPLLEHLENDINPKFESIRNLLATIARDLQGINSYRYYRQISGGLQEFIEAVAFRHYLQTQSLLTYDEAISLLPPNIHLSEDDYLLGVFDMTGELMRFAITIIAIHGQVPAGETPGQSTILADMQRLRSMLEGLEVPANSPIAREIDQKMKTMKQSVEKVENGVYEIMIRGKERPKGWVPDMKASDADREAEAY